VVDERFAPSGETEGTEDWVSYWTNGTFSGDVEVWATALGERSGWFIGMLKDVGGSSYSVDGYALRVEDFEDQVHWQLLRYRNNVSTVLTEDELALPTGHQVLLRRVGNAVTVYESDGGSTWTERLSATDSMYKGGFRLALGVVAAGPAAVAQWDDFGGGALGDPPDGGVWPLEQSFGSFCEGPGSLARVSCGMLSDPVNTGTGAFVHQETDLSLASSGVPFTWTRTYTSQDTASGRFGFGWTDTYQASLDVQPSGDVIAKGIDGQRLVFTAEGDEFVGAPGANATLEAFDDGYELVTNDLLFYYFDLDGKLLYASDRTSLGVELAYDTGGRLSTVTDSAGNTATVSYTTRDLVSGVALSDGRSVSYGYTSGRLTSFTDVRGKQWTYSYDAGGRLATIVDPLAHTQVSNVYDPSSGRVTEQTNATGDTTVDRPRFGGHGLIRRLSLPLY
jgi:YD repeat-containing protein